MTLITLERDRRTSPARLGKIALGAVFIGVAIMFAAQVAVRVDNAVLSPGDSVGVFSADGPSGAVTVLSIDGSTATVETQTGEVITVATAALAER